MQRDFDVAAAGRRFCFDPWLAVGEQNEQATRGTGMFDRDLQKLFDQLTKNDLAGHRLRGLDDGSDVQLLDRCAKGVGARRGGRSLAQMRIGLLKVLYLAERAPTKIAASRLPQTRMGDRFGAARCIEARCHLVGCTFVLHEAVFACRVNGFLVQAHRVGVSPLDAGDFGGDQDKFVGEGRRIVFGPFTELVPVRREKLLPSVLLLGSSVGVQRRDRQRCVVEVVK